MRRADAARLYYALQILLSHADLGRHGRLPRSELDLSPLQLMLMGTAMEAAVFLFEMPTGVVADTYSRRLSLIIGYPGHGHRLDARRCRFGAVADHRALGVLGPRVHVHERRRTRPGSPMRSASTTSGAFSCVARASGTSAPILGLIAAGRDRHRLAARGGDRRRSGHGRLAGLLCIFLMPETGFRRRPRAERGSALARAAHDRRERRPLRVGGAGDPASHRRRGLHGHVERGLRPAEGGALAPRCRASRGRSPRPGRLVRELLARWDGVRVRRDRPAPQAIRARRPPRRHELLFALHASWRWWRCSCSRSPGSTWVAIGALLGVFFARDLAGPLYMMWLNEQITDSSVRATVLSITRPGGRDRTGRRRAGARRDRQRLGHPRRARRRRRS